MLSQSSTLLYGQENNFHDPLIHHMGFHMTSSEILIKAVIHSVFYTPL